MTYSLNTVVKQGRSQSLTFGDAIGRVVGAEGNANSSELPSASYGANSTTGTVGYISPMGRNIGNVDK
jgi:hypothetical protein